MENRYIILDKENENNIFDYLPSNDKLIKLANYFQNFSDSTRLKIISCLSICPMCVNDMSLLLKLNQTTLSHQLQILKAQGIVEYVRQGKIIMYNLKNNIDDIMLNAVEVID